MNHYEEIRHMSITKLAGYLADVQIAGKTSILKEFLKVTDKEIKKFIKEIRPLLYEKYKQYLSTEKLAFKVFNQIKKEYIPTENIYLRGTGDIIIIDEKGTTNVTGNPNYIVIYDNKKAEI